ncbi:MAG: hypothetical protein JO249_14425 [Acidobacteria bacterium]|nr:hypothetical protein [Acidobacteriota bacterium]
MIRTQIYITEEQAGDIKLRAKREQKPEAEVIRNLLSEGLSATAQKSGVSTGDALLRLAKIGEELGATGPADLSSRIDDFLYGEDA